MLRKYCFLYKRFKKQKKVLLIVHKFQANCIFMFAQVKYKVRTYYTSASQTVKFGRTNLKSFVRKQNGDTLA